MHRMAQVVIHCASLHLHLSAHVVPVLLSSVPVLRRSLRDQAPFDDPNYDSSEARLHRPQKREVRALPEERRGV